MELGVLAVVAPLLLFPTAISPAALALLLSTYAFRWATNKGSSRFTPVDFPILGLLLSLPASLWASTDLSMSLPKVYALLLSIGVFYTITRNVNSSTSSRNTVISILLVGLAIALFGLVATGWVGGKVAVLQPIYARLPRLPLSLTSSQGTALAGIHPNELAGTLVLLLPLVAALILFSARGRALLPLAVALMALAAVVGLTASRSAALGLALAVLGLLLLRFPKLTLVVPILLVGVSLAIWYVGPGQPLSFFLGLDGFVSGGTVEDRVEVWTRAITLIQYFPFTGIGLNTFPRVVDSIYPFFRAAANLPVPHAHNLFLQVALDFGIPGLVAFLGLIWVVGKSLRDSWFLANDRLTRALVAGTGSGLLAYLGYSLTDTVALGAKPGIILWAVLGLAVAQRRVLKNIQPACDAKTAPGPAELAAHSKEAKHSGSWSLLTQAARAFVLWILLTLALVSLIDKIPV